MSREFLDLTGTREHIATHEHSCTHARTSLSYCPSNPLTVVSADDSSDGRAIGSCQPCRMAINRSPKQRTAPAAAAPEDERCSMLPITTTAAPISAATA